jgi:hypothetical protein
MGTMLMGNRIIVLPKPYLLKVSGIQQMNLVPQVMIHLKTIKQIFQHFQAVGEEVMEQM